MIEVTAHKSDRVNDCWDESGPKELFQTGNNGIEDKNGWARLFRYVY